MSSLAKNFYASKEQAQTSDNRLEIRCQVSDNILIRSMDKRKTCGYSMIALSRTESLLFANKVLQLLSLSYRMEMIYQNCGTS